MKNLFFFFFLIFFSFSLVESRSFYHVRCAIATLENIRGAHFKPYYPNQDRAFVEEKDGKCFFGIFDGHGKNGSDISEYVSKFFFQRLLESGRFSLAADIMQKDLEKNEKAQLSGTTAIMGLIEGGLLTIGNIGDSRLLYLRNNKILFTTKDHKVSDEKVIEQCTHMSVPTSEIKKTIKPQKKRKCHRVKLNLLFVTKNDDTTTINQCKSVSYLEKNRI